MNYAFRKTATMVKPMPITIPTEPIGRIPRPVEPIERVKKGDSEDPKLAPLYDAAVRDTMERFAGAGSPVVTDGEQRKHHNFCTYCVHGLLNTAQAGFMIPFSDGHTRRLSRLTRGPFRYGTHTLGGTVNL
jgi:5-methyltetrahydropteroyltriglutamate--homocysteine methyltransferase